VLGSFDLDEMAGVREGSEKDNSPGKVLDDEPSVTGTGHGLAVAVMDKLEELFKEGILSPDDELDNRAVDALKQLSEERAIAVLNQFGESSFDHVRNKSAYLCGIIRNLRQGYQQKFVKETASIKQGPDEEKLRDILSRTGYTLDVTTGQRKYGGPPPGWEGPPPGKNCEVYCGNIPKDVYEDELIPQFEKCGRIWDLRLMMEGALSQNRGYAFVTFTAAVDAEKAIKELNSLEIAPGKLLAVKPSFANTRLFVGNIPKSKTKDDIADEFSKYGSGLTEVFIYASNEKDGKKENRGFCFLEYVSHKSAYQAKRYLSSDRFKIWGCNIIVDWADTQQEPDQDTMSRVKILYCRNLAVSVTEETLVNTFQMFGTVERVKKIKDYAFIHFEKREEAISAMNTLDGEDMLGSKLDISLAKPPVDKKKKEEVLRRREQRMMESMAKCIAPPLASAYDGQGRGNSGPGLYNYGWGYDDQWGQALLYDNNSHVCRGWGGPHHDFGRGDGYWAGAVARGGYEEAWGRGFRPNGGHRGVQRRRNARRH